MHSTQKESQESQEFEFQDFRFSENSESQSSIPEPSGESKKSDNADDADIKTTWLSLFAFTTTSHIPTLIPAIILTTLAGGLKPTTSIFLGHILDDLASYVSGTITQAELLQDVSKWCIILAGLGVGAWLINGGFFALWLAFGEAQAKSVRVKMFEGMLEKEMSWFDLQRDGTGSLLVRIQTQIRELQLATSQPLGFFFEDASVALAALIIAFTSSWKLTLLLSASVPIAALLLSLLTARLRPAIESQKRALTTASARASTAIAFVDTVKSFNAQVHEVSQYSLSIRLAARAYLVQARINAAQMGASRFLVVVMFVVGFWFGLWLYNAEGLSPGSVLTAFYAFLLANRAAENLLPQWLVLVRGMSAGETLRGLVGDLHEQGREGREGGTDGESQRRPRECFGDVEVSRVTFAYPSNPEQPVLKNASMFFPAGETTFVFGRSGSGKSTIGNLLLRFYEPASGELTVDGRPIQTLDLGWLRDNVTLVQQQSTLFNETLAQNVAFGQPKASKATRDDIRLACQSAMLAETITDLPEGLNTMLSSSGTQLSGGQKQRIAIARARLRNTEILILDEATSALDHSSRELVVDAIRHWRQGKTTIIITHDPSQILENDYVYVLDHGEVVEEGYRHRLAQNSFGLFASLANDQKTAPDQSNPLSPIVEVASPTSQFSQDRGPRTTETMRAESLAESIMSDSTVDYETARTERITGMKRLSTFIGNNIAFAPQSHRQNNRMSLRIAVPYVNTLRADGIWSSSNSGAARPILVNVQKPLPALPPNSERRRSLQPLYSHMGASTETVEMMEQLRDMSMQSRVGGIRRGHWRQGSGPPNIVEYISQPQVRPKARKMRYKKFQDQTLLESRKPRPKREASLTYILSTVWPTLPWKDKTTLLLGFLFALLNAGCTPAFSYILAKLLNTFYNPLDQASEARKWALLILGIAVLNGLSSYFMHYFLEYCGRIWVDTLRVEALKRILAQPRGWFDKAGNEPSLLNETLDRNAEEMRNLVGRFAGYVFLAAAMVVIAVVWAFIVCWKLTAVALASSPAMYAFTRAFETVSGNWERKTDSMSDDVGSVFAETFLNIRVVRALTLEKYFTQKNLKAVDDAHKVGYRRATYSGIFFGISDSTNLFVTALVLYYGTVLVSNGDWPLESVLASITLLLFSIGSANDIMGFIPQISSSRATATHLLHLSHLPQIASHEALGKSTLASPFPIRLQNLNFTYPSRPTQQVLHNITLSIHAGTSTAIVGPSGSGKSTIASILLGLYPPSEPLHHPSPTLQFGHLSVFALSIQALRSHLALVPQTPLIFPASVAANITYGLSPTSPFTRPDAVSAAAREAGIHGFVASLPDGYATLIGDGGQTLSGGQAQRIAIARALVRCPKVLVLDEPTAALDAESAERVCETMGRFLEERRGVAVVVVTHDVRVMRAVGRVVLLERGRVVEVGGFEELKGRGGAFARLVGKGGWARGA